jgi:hypothetical protein
MSSRISTLSDDDNESLPPPSGLSTKNKEKATPTPAAIQQSSSLLTAVIKPSTAGNNASIPPKNRNASIPPKKKAKPSTAFSLIWVCTHGKGRNRKAWRGKDLKIMGIYSTKAIAEEAKRNVMRQYDCCGHGDILVGPTWEDEIDLVIREAPLLL